MTDPLPPSDSDVDDAGAARLFEEARSATSAPAGRSLPASPAELQSHFPELKIERVIGQGGMGVVYAARHRRLDRAVALKVLPTRLGEDPAFTERFAREARTMARLDHPHIVRVYDFGETDGFYYLVLEYVDGANLREVMHAGRLTPAEALAIVPQLCAALQYAHDRGIVHRDIKPENVLLDRQGRVKVADFGLAKLAGRDAVAATLTGTGQVMGTPHYMAPEQYRTPQDIDHRADIFSMGVVFYEMLTGELPVGRFKAPSETGVVDARIDAIVLRTLERERDLRYQRARDVESDVTRLSVPRTSTARPREGILHRPGGRWAVVLAALALPLGILAFEAAAAAWGGVERGTREVFDREVFKAVCGSVVWLLGAAAGLVAALRGARAGGRRRVQKAGVLLLALNLLLIPTAAFYAMHEAKRHAELPRAGRAATSDEPPQFVAGRFRSDIEVLWREVAAALEGGRLEMDDALHLYAQADRLRLRAMNAEELADQRRRRNLGVALLEPRVFARDPGGYEVAEVIRSGENGARALRVPAGAGSGPRIRFPVVYDGDRWRLALGPVDVHGGR